jgi:undecaprenyl diphosphate synthase
MGTMRHKIILLVVCLGAYLLVPSVRSFFLKSPLTVTDKKRKQTTLRHLSIIMDGNRRWASKNKLDVLLGHSRGGVDAAKMAIQFCLDRGISYLSLYTFSIENFKRDDSEKKCLFDLIAHSGNKDLKQFVEKDVRIRFIGDRNMFPESVKKSCSDLEEKTKNGKKLELNILFCYGGQQEIISATKQLCEKVKSGELSVSDITKEQFEKHLWTYDTPAPDFIIRTSGVQRLSNFLSYQSAYSEIYFMKCYWPEVDEARLQKAVDWFEDVKRNYGK